LGEEQRLSVVAGRAADDRAWVTRMAILGPRSLVLFCDDNQNIRGRPMRSRIAVVAFVSSIVAAGPAAAQGRGGIPVPPLPDEPWEYQTASANIRVSVLTDGLENPWSLEFLPDASILIT